MLKKAIAVGAAAFLALGIAGCSSQDTKKAAETPTKKITVYATTNVWGSVAKHIGGDKITVEEGVTRPDQDPHDYEATAQDKLKVSKAQIVIVNGGGYDDWGTKLAQSVNPKPEIINAVDISGLKKADADEHADHDHADGDHDHADADHGHDHGEEGHHHHHGDFNEHVFYSLATIDKVADELVKDLSAKDSANAATYQKNGDAFKAQIAKLQKKAAAHKEAVKHVHVIATEPVVGYLIADMGMHDITPEEYVEQSETEAGPSTKVMAQTLDLIKNGEVKGLILNGQTEDKVSDELVKAAKEKNIPVVKVYETFPEGTTDILPWLNTAFDNLSAIK